jgi:hypothetical protein
VNAEGNRDLVVAILFAGAICWDSRADIIGNTTGNWQLLALLAILLGLWLTGARERHNPSPHELNLRHATRPIGAAAVGLALASPVEGVRPLHDELVHMLHDPASNWLACALLGLVATYGAASFALGAHRCWGIVGDGLLAARAFFRLAWGTIAILYLRRFYPWHALDGPFDGLGTGLRAGVGYIGLWCVVTGAGRFALLVSGGGTALARVSRHIRRTQLVMRPASHPWWKFW